MKSKFKHGLEYIGELISFKVSGTLEDVKQIVIKYQPKRTIFVNNSKATKLEDCDSTFVEVYLLFEPKQAMLLRLSSNIDKY